MVPATPAPAPRIAASAEVMTRVECQQEEDWALLLVQLHNYSSGATAVLLAEKVGGDAMRLQPPSDPGLLTMIGVDSIVGMPELTFDCQTLKVCCLRLSSFLPVTALLPAHLGGKLSAATPETLVRRQPCRAAHLRAVAYIFFCLCRLEMWRSCMQSDFIHRSPNFRARMTCWSTWVA